MEGGASADILPRMQSTAAFRHATARGAFPYALGALLCLAAGWIAWHFTFAAHLAGEKATAARRLEFFTLSLESELARNEALPGLLALERKLGEALVGDAHARASANRYLEAVSHQAGLAAAYLMDARGHTIAASNWNRPVSFVGQNYGFRPYVLEALAGHTGRFYGIGATTGEAGFFLATRAQGPGGEAGVVAVKIGLEPFEDALRHSGETVLVADAAGVVVLSAVPELRYRALQPLDADARERLGQARQYGTQPLPPLAGGTAIAPGQDEVKLALEGVASTYSVVRRPVGPLGWQMLVLADQRASREAAWLAAIAAAALSACAAGLWLHLRLTRKRRQDKREAEAALRRASEELERRIAEQTADLTAANAELAARVESLKRAEAILHETRDAAVQAGKLTVLGQMSAGMTHELNQPLGALHTLSDNAVRLIETDRLDEAKENLRLIGELAARMGRIVKQLKLFARKEAASLSAVPLGPSLEHALLLVEPHRRELDARIEVAPLDDAPAVRADALRLEQVLVNLLRNALDAVAGQSERRLSVDMRSEGRRQVIRLRDSGPGLAREALPRLFEPFFTTKPAGQGLGLGLALSLAMVESFGGRLEAGNADGGGAEFRIVLEAA